VSEEEKVRENRLRRMADRQGLRLEKSRRRDVRAWDYGTWRLVNAQTDAVVAEFIDVDEVERRLTGPV
jgi:hypothetical protein